MSDPGKVRELREATAREPAEAAGESPGSSVAAEFAPSESGREDFWNIPNTITVVRTGLVPILVLMPFMLSKTGSQILGWLFIAAAISDLVDGWIARSFKQITKVGKLLDPLADKLIVSTALVMLLAVGRLESWTAFMVVIIVGRELAVTGLRGIASADGTIMAASGLGKAKAFTQNVAVGALLFHYETLGLPAHEVGVTLLAFASALTLWSGWDYFADYFAWRRPERGHAGQD
ncbi:MAG: CDP-diacylglycerol--glycerol-3-phosphate 3-phosphatidyltransferase [Deltaproteobacteria bacterium]|nr:CDP-diacylglycerol--glycerol-3-phosphate 3-phosphatidyltransferase [Deltaproteobacteria bacterium]MBW2421743.1 CDP-diacylglycerol--glycerol-3-phosphate 3-phosphatidyltransferase [Deltaproteobacteria bacterium]